MNEQSVIDIGNTPTTSRQAREQWLFLANIGEKIADRLPKFVEIAGGFLAVTLLKGK